MPAPNPPISILGNTHLLEVWRKSHHILPAAAFEAEFAHTVLLPIISPRVAKEVNCLSEIIRETPSLNIKALSVRSQMRYSRCRQILRFREGIDWRALRQSGENWVRYFPEFAALGAQLIPRQISVEYLAAELEREGFEIRVELRPGRSEVLCIGGRIKIWPGFDAWLKTSGSQIMEYIRVRDGLSPCRHYPE